MSEPTSTPTTKHWWTLTGRLGVASRLGALVVALALGAVSGIVWLSPSAGAPTAEKSELEKQLELENADLRAVLADREDELAALERSQEKARTERAGAAERGREKGAAEKAAARAAEERGEQKAAAEKAAAAERGKQKAAAEKAAAGTKGKQRAAQERLAADRRAAQKASLERELARVKGAADAARAAAAEAAARAAAEKARGDDLSHQVNNPAPRPPAPPKPRPVTPTLDQLRTPQDRYFGLYTNQSPFNWAEFDDITRKVGATPDMSGYFQGWDGDFRPDAVTRSWEKGMLPLLTWESRPMLAANDQAVDPNYSLPVIINGKYDDYLRKYARDVAAHGMPLAIRLNHEMNGSWYPWGEREWGGGPLNGNRKGDFVKMWRHVHDIFEEEGANEFVLWVWAPNIVNALPDYGKYSSWYMKSLYPGDEYVDWVGLSGYFRPPYRADQTPTFSYTYDRSLNQLREFTKKPILLAEIGASEIGNQKPLWVSDLFAGLARPENQDIIGIAWFHHTVTTISGGQRVTNDWRINSRRDSLDAFIKGIHDPAARFGYPPLETPLAAAGAEAAAAAVPEPAAGGTGPAPTPVQGPPTPVPSPTITSPSTPVAVPSPTAAPEAAPAPAPDPAPGRLKT
ncbi:glycosyl hydrolase [Cellulomonas sp. 179-A 9B4 NHS]|uniref:glycosyl hydrolase n=1 Tax=Cellulomonas sp. 179-A 9B4 NHS TaxID=3142379 RepID=UPI0039A188CC